MDIALWSYEHGVPVSLAATRAGVAPELMKHAYRDIEAKRRSAQYLHAPPLLIADAPALGVREAL
jgi:NAD+ synthase